jgi:hypothetical protein
VERITTPSNAAESFFMKYLPMTYDRHAEPQQAMFSMFLFPLNRVAQQGDIRSDNLNRA